MIVDIFYYAFMLGYLLSTVGMPIVIGLIWTLRTMLRKTTVAELLSLTAYWAVIMAGYAALTPYLLRLAASC